MQSDNRSNRQPIRVILEQDDFNKKHNYTKSTDGDVAKLLAPIANVKSGVFELSLKIGNTLGKQLNLKNSKRVEKLFHYSYNTVIRSTVASIGSLKYEFTTLLDTAKGAIIEAELPVDIFSLGGTVLFEIIEMNTNLITVIGISEIKGQLFDWGKGKRSLEEIFEKIEMYCEYLVE